jgi:hypothetical protein
MIAGNLWQQALPPAFAFMAQDQRAEYIKACAEELIKLAERSGVALRIDRVPTKPLAMGRAQHVAEAWVARHSLAPHPAWPFPTETTQHPLRRSNDAT